MTPQERRELALLILETVPLMARTLDARTRGARPEDRVFPPHIAILKRISDKPSTQGELADFLYVGAPTVSATIDALERRGWVRRERLNEDRRVVRIEITSEGGAVLMDIDESRVAMLETLLDSLTDEQQTQALAGLRILKETFAAAVIADFDAHARLIKEGKVPPPPPFPTFESMVPPPSAVPFTVPLPPDFVPPPDFFTFDIPLKDDADDTPPVV